MNREQAQEVLRCHRADRGLDPADTELADALRLVQEDPTLAGWWQDQRVFDRSVREAFQAIPVPTRLAGQILRERPLPARFHGWRNPWIMAAAAAIALSAGAWLFWGNPSEVRFAAFRNRLARAALRDYKMSFVTNDLNAIRSYLARNQAPADYQIPAPVRALPGLGCGIVEWQGQPVSMLCFDRGKGRLLWLFASDVGVVRGAPEGTQPSFERVGTLTTATWKDGRTLYVLAVVGDEGLLRQYL